MEFILYAFPETKSSQLEKKEPLEFKGNYPISHESVSQLKMDLQTNFLDKFPNSEDYFDKTQSLKNLNYSGYE